ncbi:tail fiber assembly protein [Yersinia kristensenii]|uniref:Putative tail fiber assembly protein n=1 Tax=Yersinia kristensenii TaxID=28152 RepID=A0A0T9KLV1_YERKR|nr:tail assembly chaperone [Yersinia kristensenii]CNE11911.1 putative tail fiber assembly protein [Yersinia kristensenii]
MTIEFFDKDGYAIESGIVTVYNISSETREYIGKTEEFITVGTGLPAHAYLDEPLKAKNGFAVCRTKDFDSWEYVADHRGETRYSTITKHEIMIKELGEYPQDSTNLIPFEFGKWNGTTWIVDESEKSAATIQSAALKKAELKSIADSEISWRQDAVDGGYAEPEEIVDIATWKKYRVLLMRIDTSKAPNVEWPVAPE